MQITLLILSGPAAGKKRFLRDQQSLTVGRSDEADFMIAGDHRLSRVHFRVSSEALGCRLRDETSANGTFLNGQRINEVLLQHGDKIQAGGSVFQVSIQGDADPSKIAELAFPPYLAAMEDDDPEVRRTVLRAAIWGQQKWVLDLCRAAAKQPAAENQERIAWLAILGLPDDGPLLQAVAKNAALGPERMLWLGKFGHPQSVTFLLSAMRDSDPATASAAGIAYTRLTGVDVSSERTAKAIPPASDPPDPWAEEFAPEVVLPDAERADAHWSSVKDQFLKSPRWCRGIDLKLFPSREVLASFDLESRTETCLRGRYWGAWTGSWDDLYGFPLREISRADSGPPNRGRGPA